MEIYNEYGPTETTVGCIVKRLGMNEAIQIGRPISNTGIYILSEGAALVPVGFVGEICVGGAGVGQGYLNRSELTAEKFVDNPYNPGSLMYKTGDLGRWLADGNIEYLGRRDEQVKVRGYRIELGEIASVLENYPGIGSSVVVARTSQDEDKQLVAYVVSKDSLATTRLRSYLSMQLPAYMVPGLYVQLESFPLTVNGKINKQALPAPESLQLSSGVAYIAPGNATEDELVSIWSQVLSLEKERIGIRDNFFDLGGNSLKIVRLSKLVSDALGKQISVPTLFQYSTIKDLTDYLEGKPSAIEEESFDRDELLNDINKFKFD